MSNASTETRLTVLEVQVKRIVSDIESEKGTRSRAGSDLNARLDQIDHAQRKQERILYIGMGALGALQFLIGIYVALKN